MLSLRQILNDNLNNEKLPYIDKIVYLIVGDTNNEILKRNALFNYC